MFNRCDTADMEADVYTKMLAPKEKVYKLTKHYVWRPRDGLTPQEVSSRGASDEFRGTMFQYLGRPGSAVSDVFEGPVFHFGNEKLNLVFPPNPDDYGVLDPVSSSWGCLDLLDAGLRHMVPNFRRESVNSMAEEMDTGSTTASPVGRIRVIPTLQTMAQAAYSPCSGSTDPDWPKKVPYEKLLAYHFEFVLSEG